MYIQPETDAVKSSQQLSPDPAQYGPIIGHLANIAAKQEGEDKGLFTVFSIKEGRPKPDIAHIPNTGDPAFIVKRIGLAIEKLAQTPGANIYLMPCLVRTGTKGRGKKEDVLSLLAIVVEFDKKHSPETRHDRLPCPPHAEVESSPGLFHSWYFLSHPATPADAVPVLCALVDAVGSDDCKTPEHGFRCPGTWNYPNAKKIEAGRSPEPVMSQLRGDNALFDWAIDGPPSIFLTQLAAHIGVKYPGAFAAQEKGQEKKADADASFDWEQRATSLVPMSEEEVDEYWNNPKMADRSEAAYAFFCAATRRGYTPAETLEISLDNISTAVGEHYEAKTNAEGALRKEIKKAYLEAAAGLTAKTTTADTHVEFTEEDATTAKDMKLALNEKYAVVKYGNRALIADTTDKKIEFIKIDDFKALHANEFISTPSDDGKRDRKLLVQSWLAWKDRRQYIRRGVVFEPTQPREIPGDMLNLWTGFAVEPKQGDCSRLWDHLREVVCSGNLLHYTYMRNWMAACVQWLDDPGQVVLVIRGAHGSGKGVLFRTIVQLFGQHGAHIFNPDQLTGKFNALSADKLPVFLDEALWAGDKRAASNFKGLATEPFIPLERKGIDPIMIRNRTRYMIASNHALPAHIEAGDRRFFVVECAATYAYSATDTEEQGAVKRAYFNALFYGGERKGIMPPAVQAAFLYDLQHIDLAGFDISNLPQSDTKSDLIRRGLSGVEAWLDQVLHDGAIWSNHWDDLEGLTIRKDEAYNAYEAFAQARKEWHAELKDQWMKTVLEALGPAATSSRHRADGGRVNSILFGPLSLCREEFSKSCKSTYGSMGWDDTDTDADDLDALLGITEPGDDAEIPF